MDPFHLVLDKMQEIYLVHGEKRGCLWSFYTLNELHFPFKD